MDSVPDDVLAAMFRLLDPTERPHLRLVCLSWRGVLGPPASWRCLQHWECYHPGVCAYGLLARACADGRLAAAQRLAPCARADAGRARGLYRLACNNGREDVARWLATVYGLPAATASSLLVLATHRGHEGLAAWLRATARSGGIAPGTDTSPATDAAPGAAGAVAFCDAGGLGLAAAALEVAVTVTADAGALDILACRRATRAWRAVGGPVLAGLARALAPERIRTADAAALGSLARRLCGASPQSRHVIELARAASAGNRYQRLAAERILAGQPIVAGERRSATRALSRLRAALVVAAAGASRWPAAATKSAAV
jgi:hypothetical protein